MVSSLFGDRVGDSVRNLAYSVSGKAYALAFPFCVI